LRELRSAIESDGIDARVTALEDAVRPTKRKSNGHAILTERRPLERRL
jgi:hypothetical protein